MCSKRPSRTQLDVTCRKKQPAPLLTFLSLPPPPRPIHRAQSGLIAKRSPPPAPPSVPTLTADTQVRSYLSPSSAWRPAARAPACVGDKAQNRAHSLTASLAPDTTLASASSELEMKERKGVPFRRKPHSSIGREDRRAKNKQKKKKGSSPCFSQWRPSIVFADPRRWQPRPIWWPHKKAAAHHL